jgi:hypothetical protein
MTLTEMFKAKREEAKEEALAEWSQYLQQRSSVEDLQETVRVFSGELSRKAKSAYEEFTPLQIHGFESRTSGSTRTNVFLWGICRNLEYALRVFKPDGDPIAEYLNRDKETLIVDWLKQSGRLDPTTLYKPEAYKMSDTELALLLGEYQGRRDALQSILDEPKSEEPAVEGALQPNSLTKASKKYRTQVMLAILLLKFEHGVHVLTRDEQSASGSKNVGFNQERLAEVLAIINQTSDVARFKNHIRDVLDLYGKLGSKKLLESAKKLVEYISGNECTELTDAIRDEISMLDED